MTKTDSLSAIVRVLNIIQELSGREYVDITESMCPIGDLNHFDSLNGIEASVLLSSELGFDLPGVSVFVNEQGTKALTVNEIADAICEAAKMVVS